MRSAGAYDDLFNRGEAARARLSLFSVDLQEILMSTELIADIHKV